jgi:hypothetical protein
MTSCISNSFADLYKACEFSNSADEFSLAKRTQYNQKWSYVYRPPIEDFLSISAFIANKSFESAALEIGAGRGLWGELYTRYCIEYKITNAGRWLCTESNAYDYHFSLHQQCDAITAIEEYGIANTLVSIYPELNSTFTYDALKQFKGNQFIYIAEPRGGANATSSLYNLLDRRWKIAGQIKLISPFPGDDISCIFYLRKKLI